MKETKLSRRTTPPRQAAFAKDMRQDMTGPERKLWKALRWRVPIEGTHFRRQVSLGPYIVDFCSYGAKIVIEVDRNPHGTMKSGEQDANRTAFMETQGYRVLRFSNRDVMLHIDIVLDTIAAALSTTSTPDPSPTPSPSLHNRLPRLLRPRGGGEKQGGDG
jgi:very-short-patch-repair endonuclease